jgi:hypothetical protein
VYNTVSVYDVTLTDFLQYKSECGVRKSGLADGKALCRKETLLYLV